MSKCSLWDGVVLLRYTGCLDRHPQLHDGPRRNKTAERWAHLHTSHRSLLLLFFMLLCLCWLSAHQWLYTKLEGHSLLRFCCWTLYPACLCAVAASFCDNVCPASTGLSGMLFGGAGLSAAASYELTLVLLIKNKKSRGVHVAFLNLWTSAADSYVMQLQIQTCQLCVLQLIPLEYKQDHI